MTEALKILSKTAVAALIAAAVAFNPVPAAAYLCPKAERQATIAEKNLMSAIARVFTGRWARDAIFGMRVTVGSDCADVTLVNTMGLLGRPSDPGRSNFKLWRVSGSGNTYELDTATGGMVGTIDFDKLGSDYRVNHYFVTIPGLPGAVCDGLDAGSGQMHPGQCMNGYVSQSYNETVPAIVAAFQYIWTVFPPAETLHAF